ncbi:MAG TPA: TolC family protein [Flavisolibacter sp.]|nr:TolC family protein [Flavisolibacter sp.]
MKKILFIGLSVCSFGANAQRLLTIEEAIATSLNNNFDIQLARNDSTIAALDYAFANYALYPRLNANGGVLFNNNNQKQTLADGTKRERKDIKSTNINASLNLNWTLFDGFKMFITRRRLGELVKLGELQIKEQVVNTVADVMRLYYDIVRQQQQIRATEEQMVLSNDRLSLARYKFEIGAGVKTDMLQAQVDYNAQRATLLAQQTNLLQLKDQLNNLLMLPTLSDFAVTDTIIVNTDLTIDAIRSALTTSNPQLQIAQRNLSIANLTLQERRADRFPVVAFNSAYNFSRTNNNTVINPFQPLFNQNRGLNYGLTATIPIFNGYNTRRLIRAAEINIQFQELLYERNLAAINTSVQVAYRNYYLHKRTLQLEEENIALVRENLFIAKERYRLGVSTFLEMRIAEQSLADALNRLINTRYNTKVAEIELLRLRGDLVR